MKNKSNQQQTANRCPYPSLPKEKKKRDMTNAERVQFLQRKLYLKAKQEKDYKFYVLYDKLFLDYILEESWKRVKRGGGGCGVDNIGISEIESQGVKEFLVELQEDLWRQTYVPSAIKRKTIPKKTGGVRQLGIPTIRDRVAQMACKLILEPIFEADFVENSYGFRPDRSTHNALQQVKTELKKGNSNIYDLDLSKYFDTIPHQQLEKALRLRIADKRVIDIIKKWLHSPYEENNRKTGGRKQKQGVPQGGVISPLLSNVYLHLLDRIVVHPENLFVQKGIKYIRYADDFLLMGKEIGEQAKNKLHDILSRMGLKINTNKSKHLEAKKESFNFLGFRIRYDKSQYQGYYWNVHASKSSEQEIRTKVKEKLQKIGHFSPARVAIVLNEILRGWLNNFTKEGLYYSKEVKRRLERYLYDRLNRYYNRKSQRKCSLYRQRAYDELARKYGLIKPTKYRC